jgi:hypothetical protein
MYTFERVATLWNECSEYVSRRATQRGAGVDSQLDDGDDVVYDQEIQSVDELKIMSFNINNLGVDKKEKAVDRLLKLFTESKAHIVAVQECKHKRWIINEKEQSHLDAFPSLQYVMTECRTPSKKRGKEVRLCVSLLPYDE